MLKKLPSPVTRHVSVQSGMTMIEVLVTIVVLAFGLLGLAAFQMRTQIAELESVQRAQALVLMQDMAARLQANGQKAASYAGSLLGTGASSGTDQDCAGADADRVECDKEEWSSLLRGSTNPDKQSGNLVGGRGCISQIQAPNTAAGVCQPGIYLVEVAWQGMMPTSAPASTCGAGAYGNENERRVVSTRVTIGTLNCW